MLLAPVLRAKPSVLRDELPRLRQRGFQRVRLDGAIRELDEPNLVPTGAGGGRRRRGRRPAGRRRPSSAAASPIRLSWPSARAATGRSSSRRRTAEAPWRELAPEPAPGLRHLRRRVREADAAAFLVQPPRGRLPGVRRPRPQAAPRRRAGRSPIRRSPSAEARSSRGASAARTSSSSTTPSSSSSPSSCRSIRRCPGRTCRRRRATPSCTGTGERLFAFKLRRMREARADALRRHHRRHRAELPRHRERGIPGAAVDLHGRGPVPGMRRHPPQPRAAPPSASGRPRLPTGFPGLHGDGHRRGPRLRGAALSRACGSSEALREVVVGIEQRLRFLLDTGLGYLTSTATTRRFPAGRRSGCASPPSSGWA